jgi:hypothetical protein
VKRDPSEFEPTDSSRDDLLADLAAKREELRITVHDLKVSAPPIGWLVVGTVLTLVCFLGSLFLLAAPYVHPVFPRSLSLAAAFAVVVLTFAGYALLRRLSAQHERRRLQRTVMKRAVFLDDIADDLLEEVREFEPKAASR